MSKYQNLQDLIDQDQEASSYFNKLPDYVKDQIYSRAGNVNSFASLKDCAENILRGDN